MNPTRKTVILPSGASCKIRRLSAHDVALTAGDIPIIAPDAGGEGKKLTDKAIELGLRITRAALTRCTGKLTYPDGTQKQIVDKSIDDSDDEKEITIEELDQADADFLAAEIFALSGMRKEAAPEGVKPFPEKPESNGNAGCDSEALPEATE